MGMPYVVAITGASGAVYAVRLLDALVELGQDVLLTISPSGQTVLKQELALDVDLAHFTVDQLRLTAPALAARHITYDHFTDYMSPMASGSAPSAGMVICPCSGGTLSAVAHAASTNLIQRAAEVHLKERRKLILVPRETPLSLLALDNMRRASEAGAVILPAAPGWYQGVRSVRDLVDFIVARILDQLGIEHGLSRRWGESPEES